MGGYVRTEEHTRSPSGRKVAVFDVNPHTESPDVISRATGPRGTITGTKALWYPRPEENVRTSRVVLKLEWAESSVLGWGGGVR